MSVDIASYLANQGPTTSTISNTSGTDALSSGQANLSSSYQTFLTLLTSQLKNQDPTSPLDTNAFTQQLVQMTGVQQQLLSNTLLQQLVAQGGGTVSGAVDLIGKTVTATGDSAPLSSGKASWSYSLPQSASQATMTVSDSTGRVVWSGAAPDLTAGSHTFTWDGKNSSGQPSPDGAYKLAIKAVNANGANVTATTAVTGVVSSISQANGATVINIGAIQAPLTAITAVTAS
ncbi:MAG TPA: flagellar hook assembly protein FlgD [Caulobacteraceae bacterium]|jgi:flagellar basal-body rod modification protein FlgD|nr:flagellar hook assembly protein FlgD [Caulobacteraceae bacterium]